ncbi:MAG: redoxin family protein [Myxococcales bacterium]|nr:redoxin family protein [Myxococcales bacterium]MCB9733577.1 redoxin family protein [Deltaproteobacteria bacterium]
MASYPYVPPRLLALLVTSVMGGCAADDGGASPDLIGGSRDTAAAMDGGGGTDTAPGQDGAVADIIADTLEPAVDADANPQPDTATADAGDTLDDVGADMVAGEVCPPVGPYGTSVGDTLADLVLEDCDGVPHHIHDLCGLRAGYLSTYTGWCPPCQADADAAPAEYERLKSLDPDFEWFFIVTEDQNFDLPTAFYCDAVRDRFGLPMPVLVDAQGVFPRHIGVTTGNTWHVVLDPAGRIVFKGHYAADDAEAALDAALGD